MPRVCENDRKQTAFSFLNKSLYLSDKPRYYDNDNIFIFS